MVTRALARSSPEQDVLGPIDAGGQIGGSTDIGMHALNEPTMGGADFVRGRAGGQSQDCQRLVARHIGTWPRWWRSVSGAPIHAQPTVEIGFENLARVGIGRA